MDGVGNGRLPGAGMSQRAYQHVAAKSRKRVQIAKFHESPLYHRVQSVSRMQKRHAPARYAGSETWPHNLKTIPRLVAFFDFDGTLSLIRTGWQQIMIPMMVDLLLELKSGETADEIRAVVDESVWRLTGRETIFQMEALMNSFASAAGSRLPRWSTRPNI